MTALQTLNHILVAGLLKRITPQDYIDLENDTKFQSIMNRVDGINSSNIDEIFEYFSCSPLADILYDVEFDLLAGECESGIPCEGNRNYETTSVAAQSPYGVWIGWTYYSGGGKHGEPESCTRDAMQECYFLDAKTEIKTVIILSFKQQETHNDQQVISGSTTDSGN
jgi:hypothetical protein